MSNKKRTPCEPVQEERRALEDYTTKELVEEFRKRQNGIGLILEEEKTFKNPFDYPLLLFIVPELECDLMKPRMKTRLSHYMKTHQPSWWILPLIEVIALVSVAFAILAIWLQR